MVDTIGPGPGAFLLPTTIGYKNHDVRKQRGPEYSFGIRSTKTANIFGPSPNEYVFSATKYGEINAPAYSFGIKPVLREIRIGPGPAEHFPVKIFKGRNAPEYTMAGRPLVLSKAFGPAPNAYKINLKTAKQAAPAFSMGIRTKMLSTKQISPGPSAYFVKSELGKNPAYSMGLRTKGVSIKGISPGPNNYFLQNYKPGDNGPKYSFGVRHSPRAPPMVVKGDNECYKHE